MALVAGDPLRYGENPHQKAQLMQRLDEPDPIDLTLADMHASSQGMSYSNYVDADAALGLCRELAREDVGSDCACVIVKHTNPCGVGVGHRPAEAYRGAYLGDPSAAMGGVLACSFPVRHDIAGTIMDSLARWGKSAGCGAFFLDVWVAPSFDEEAVDLIHTKKAWGQRVRLLATGEMDAAPDAESHSVRSIAGGVLRQSHDLVGLNEDEWEVVTERAPSEREMNDLRLAWLVAKHTKSNAISLVRDGQLIGNGAGQMSRVMACRVAVWMAEENGHIRSDGATERRSDEGRSGEGFVAASDGFFPFRDGPEMLMDAGATAIIQPGGSKRDADTIAACHERGVAMIFTHTRHFRH
jgi:phosphoribosylaminoimidazolecarboxamide formyltransferase/IMP cyclohydrolase